MSWRRLVLAVATLLLAVPGTARSDADPASDVLLGENVFYPYQPPVSAQLQSALNAATAAAARAGFPIHVALIASPSDLGAITELFGQPQRYAAFLDREITYNGPVPVLVVMAAGYGMAGMSRAAEAASASLPPPAGKSSDSLARAAVVAVEKLAAADGHPISPTAVRGGGPSRIEGGGGRSNTLDVAILFGVSIACAWAAIVLRRRRAKRARS